MSTRDFGQFTRRMLPRNPMIARSAASILTPPATARKFSWQFLAIVLIVTALMMIWRDERHPPLGSTDLYPLYYGAQGWMQRGDAYQLAHVAPLSDQGHPLFLIGNAYPLPAVLLVLPLSFLSLHAAAVIWVGLLTAGLLLALRLYGASCWLILYWPLLEAIRIEQYTAFVIGAQILALWALRERRPWLLGITCSLVLTKPTQGALFVVALLALTSDRIRPLGIIGGVWGGTLLLDPDWPQKWLSGLDQYNAVAWHPYYWQLALLALPLLALRSYYGAAITASFALFRFPLPAPYMASTLPLVLLHDRRIIWVIPISYLWWPLVGAYGYAWTVTLAFFLPVISLVVWRFYTQTDLRQKMAHIITRVRPRATRRSSSLRG